MLLVDLQELTKLGVQKPLSMWLPEYQARRRDLAGALATVAEGIEAGTGVRENIERLVEIFKTDQPNEYELSRLILHTAEFFKEQVDTLSTEDQKMVFTFISDSKKFYDRAQTAEFLGREREKIKTTMPVDQQIVHDRRLFELEGMMYCLEYYLTLYKAIFDAPNESAKRKVIESTEIDCGYGEIPGLWIDFDKDEVLQKFILKILDNDLRQDLETAYYTTKEKVAKIKMICDKQGVCSVVYESVTLDEVIAAFKELIKVFITAFQKVGIEQLSSYFLTPFGKNTKLSEINL